MASIMEAIQGLVEMHKKFGNIPIGVAVDDRVHNIVGFAIDEDTYVKLADGEVTVFCCLHIDDVAVTRNQKLKAGLEH